MGINRPVNLNIRDVPGNASIVGPSTSPSCYQTDTLCETCHNRCGSASAQNSLGSQYVEICTCACCDVVCGCCCRSCDRTTPSGIYKQSEQYTAREADTWGDDSSCNDAVTCLCNINNGTITQNITFTAGYVICKNSNVAWVVAPDSTEVQRSWYCRADAVTVAQAAAACGDWFIPNVTQMSNPGYSNRGYWDSNSGGRYWTNDGYSARYARSFMFNNGPNCPQGGPSARYQKTRSFPTRAFRCVSY